MKYNERLYEELRGILAQRLSGLRHIEDDELYELIDEEIAEREENVFFPVEQKISLRRALFDSFRRLDILQELLDRADITEIMVNGSENIFVEQSGQSLKVDRSFRGEEQLEDVIQQIVSKVNRSVNTSNPIVDARLSDGSRVHVVLPPISLDGAVVTIRKFPEPISIEKLISYGAITRQAADMLSKLVRAGYNIFISGGTNSGKTTFLNALSSYIPNDERVITIEDSAELQLVHIKNIVRLEARRANSQGDGEVSIADLIKASLRMNPDRIVVGEVRGAEALDMLQAMNTGHDGSLSTGHGNSPKDMLSRLETMVLTGANLPLPAIRAQISSAIDILIHLGRLRDRSRRVLAICEIGEYKDGEIGLNTLYEFEEEKGSSAEGRVVGTLKKKGELIHTQKLIASGNRV